MNINISHNVMKENPLYFISESKLVFKKKNVTVNLSQITDLRLIKFRSFRLNIIILALFYMLGIILSPYLKLDIVLFNLIFGFVPLLCSFYIKRYSYKLLINENNCNYNEIVVNRDNLNLAKMLIDSFLPVISLPKGVSKLSERSFPKGL